MTLTKLFTSVANMIRSLNPHESEKIKAVDFPEAIGRACEEAEYTGYNNGRRDEYDAFWDGFQDNGNKPQYTYSFWGWYDGAYNPKYPIVCQANWSTVDIFRASYITDTLVDIELQGNNQADRMFYDCFYLTTVRKLKLDAKCRLGTAFRNCQMLENITFEGEIGCDIDFHWSTLLTVESLRSILTALSKNNEYANGKTVTFNTASKAVIEADADCTEQLALAVSAGWAVAYNS